MPKHDSEDESFSASAQELYERVRAGLGAAAMGQYIVLDVDSGDYDLAAEAMDAHRRMRERRPEGRFAQYRVGYVSVAEPRMPNIIEIPEAELDAWLEASRSAVDYYPPSWLRGGSPRAEAATPAQSSPELEGMPVGSFGEALEQYPHPFVFVTVSGSHLYGFPSQDSDFDLRGSHVLPGEELWRLDAPRETDEPKVETPDGLIEIVTHDLRKFVRLLLKRNGYVLEQVTSPLVVRTTPVHAELVRLVPGVLTRNHYHHYRGFYHTERKEYDRSEPRSVKKLLYAYRVLMTGCVLLREGVVEANLQNLNERFGYGFLDELVEIKKSGERVGIADDGRYLGELEKLEAEMDRAYEESKLPETPSVRQELDELIVRVREQGVNA